MANNPQSTTMRRQGHWTCLCLFPIESGSLRLSLAGRGFGMTPEDLTAERTEHLARPWKASRGIRGCSALTAIRICRCSRTLSEAGRRLFAALREQKANPNDADRLRKYLTRFGLEWQQLQVGQ